jgi:hypothetical protein
MINDYLRGEFALSLLSEFDLGGVNFRGSFEFFSLFEFELLLLVLLWF